MTPEEIFHNLQEQAEMGASRPQFTFANKGDVFIRQQYLCIDGDGDLRFSLFIDCDLRGSDLRKANAEEATFVRCRLVATRLPEGVRCVGCEMYNVFASPSEQRRGTHLIRRVVKAFRWLFQIVFEVTHG